jgi:hypothetical protein
MATLTVHTATALSRRASMLAIGGAALAASAAPMPTRAGKASKKAKKRCKRQVGQCESMIAPACAAADLLVSEEECVDTLLPCCQPFKDCQADAVFDCLIAASEAMAAPP